MESLRPWGQPGVLAWTGELGRGVAGQVRDLRRMLNGWGSRVVVVVVGRWVLTCGSSHCFHNISSFEPVQSVTASLLYSKVTYAGGWEVTIMTRHSPTPGTDKPPPTSPSLGWRESQNTWPPPHARNSPWTWGQRWQDSYSYCLVLCFYGFSELKTERCLSPMDCFKEQS